MKNFASKGSVKILSGLFALITGMIVILSSLLVAGYTIHGIYDDNEDTVISDYLSDYDVYFNNRIEIIFYSISDIVDTVSNDELKETAIKKMLNDFSTNGVEYKVSITGALNYEYSTYGDSIDDSDYYSNQYSTSFWPDDENATEPTYTIDITLYQTKDITANSEFYESYQEITQICQHRYLPVIVLVFSSILFLLLLSMLAYGSGRHTSESSVQAHGTAKIPLDLWLIFLGIGGLLLPYSDQFSYTNPILFTFHLRHWSYVGLYFAAIPTFIFLILWMDAWNRIKIPQFWKNSILYRFGNFLSRGLVYFFLRLNLIWKAGIIIFGIAFVEFLFLYSSITQYTFGSLMFFWFLEKILIIPVIFYLIFQFIELKKGAKAIATGDFTHQIDTKYLIWELKDSAEDLNSIQLGIQSAVNESMKNERMKTELLTNVSHDIKTPLTSIVNYVDLLSREDLSPDIAREYVAVLQKHSMRLKHLIEDLVDASKAATGNLDIQMILCDIHILLGQILGEYESRTQEKNLQVITRMAETPVMIMGDGKLLFRVFDNLLSNICKYAMSGSRVYISLLPGAEQVVIEFKNISAMELNISPEELTERFVRGDASRNTEGSGLGLSIAQSLIQLQNGRLDLMVDGDLFKAVVTFPLTKNS